MPYVAHKQATLLIPSGPSDGMHLYVIMTDACRDNQHLLISISTIRKNKYFDDTCTINIGEHSFITDDSYVYYKEPLLRKSESISKCIDGCYFIEKEDINAPVFQLICNGIARSKFTPKWAEDYYNANM